MATLMTAGRTFDRRDPCAVRRAIRAGLFRERTIAVAPGFVQANLLILPAQYASDFQRYCQQNPKACPILASSEPGDPRIPALGEDLDLRTDLGSYRVFRDGAEAGDVSDISDLWREDFVAFALGCSWSVEEALVDAGVRLRHIALGEVTPIYVTNLPTVPAGPFHGPLLVSMRLLRAADAIRAVQITSRFPNVHGAPVHLGDPRLIGIASLKDSLGGYGLRTPEPDELPVFWACGVTPQFAACAAKLPIAIAHTPGFMLVTDLRNSTLAAF
jgi:uncharacterized protein YcsI (UPF0317 family)